MPVNKTWLFNGKKPGKTQILAAFIFLTLFSFTTNAFTQDSISQQKPSKIAFNGYVKDMQTVYVHDIYKEWVSDNLIHNRLNFKWNISNSFTFCIEDRNRFYWGDLTNINPQYANYIAADNGIVNMSWNIFQGNTYVLNTTIDRLWLDYTHDKFEVTLGRQRINWSQTVVWNPNDIFNTYSYFDFDYEEKPGSDALRIQYYTGPSSKAEIAVKENKDKKLTAAGLYRFNHWKYDFQGLAGIYDQSDLVLGLGWAGQIAKGGFKGEFSWFRPVKRFSDTTGVFLTSVEYDYTFRNSIFIQFECFYNSNNTNITNLLLSQLNPELLNAKNPFLNGVSVFGNISYPVTPLINISLASIYNPSNRMVFIIPDFTFSLMNNLDLSIIAQSFQSYDPAISGLMQTALFLRLKGSF
jgi:hypothetical protein